MSRARAHREAVWARDGGICQICGRPCTRRKGPRQGTIDHVVPRSRGGSSEPSNLQLACKRCNTAKGAQMPAHARVVAVGGIGTLTQFGPRDVEHMHDFRRSS